MKEFLQRLKDANIIVADGAMGTMLIGKGLKPGGCPELYNLTHPKIVEEINRLYLNAGAEVIATNTFGASPLKLARYGLRDKTEEINRTAVLLTRKIAGDKAYVAACIGPSGKILKPYGDTEPEEITDSFKRQIKVLMDTGIDVIWIETMTDLREAALAIKAAKSISPMTPVITAMTFDKTRKGYYTIMGNSITDAVNALQNAGADIIGSNCGNGIENMIEIAHQLRKHTNLAISIRPNAGLPIVKDNIPFYPETPEFFAQKIPELIELNVSIIGGCCGTTSEHIRAIKKVADSYLNAQ